MTPRRRIYLMRHGAVDYFREDGSAASPHTVPLNAAARGQADTAGRLFADAGIRFDTALTSGLPRALETAARVLAGAGQPVLPLAVDERLQEVRPGRLDDLARDEVERAFTGVFNADDDVERHRFMGGESIGELLDRVLPAFEELLGRDDWRCLLLVLHGGVNRALLARAASGRRGFLGRLEQGPGCINIIEVGAADIVLRAVNLTPTQWLQQDERSTTMEKLLAQYLKTLGQVS
jgi:broad specificity phosphatase PhoE